MIFCYACNQWKPGDIAPFAICDECQSPEKRRQREKRHAQEMLPLYWQMKPIEQDGIRDVAKSEVGA